MNETVLKYLARFIVLLTAIPIHETAHAYISYKLGDPTAKNLGRLSLNPLRHIDPIGSICLLAFGIGWAKPVPVDPRYYANRKAGMALSALAGPVSNLLMAYLSMCAYKITVYASYGKGSAAADIIALIFYYMIFINISLGVFNLMPFPPFDGSRIVTAALPERWYFSIMKYERYIFFAVFALLYLGVFDKPLEIANGAVLSFLDAATSYVDAIAIRLL